MSVEIAVVDELKATAAVSAIVGTRVHQLILPQEPTLPAVRVQLISEPKLKHLRGPHNSRRARIQVDAITSASYDAAVTLADEIDEVFSGEPFTRDGIMVIPVERDSRIPDYESGTKREVRIIQDFIVWWRTTT